MLETPERHIQLRYAEVFVLAKIDPSRVSTKRCLVLLISMRSTEPPFFSTFHRWRYERKHYGRCDKRRSHGRLCSGDWSRCLCGEVSNSGCCQSRRHCTVPAALQIVVVFYGSPMNCILCRGLGCGCGPMMYKRLRSRPGRAL